VKKSRGYAIDMYIAIKEGKQRSFPRGFWKGERGRENSRLIVRYLVENELDIEIQDIRKKLTRAYFYKAGLSGLLTSVYNTSVYQAVEDAYPGILKRWQFRVPNNYWSGGEGEEHGAEATKWLIEEKLRIPIEEIPKRITQKTFSENGLIGMLDFVFGGSPFKAIDSVYPGRFKPWQFSRVGNVYWKSDNGLERAKDATRWLIEDVLKIEPSEVPRTATRNTFRKNDLCGMLDSIFKGSPYDAIENAYPGRFEPWEFSRTKYRFWMGDEGRERARRATRWMIEEKLKLNPDEIPGELSKSRFEEYGIDGMVSMVYGSSIFKAIDDAHPSTFKPWQFRVRNRFWSGKEGKAHGIEATKWLIEDVLGVNEAEIPKLVDHRAFLDAGLGGMLNHAFGGSYIRAILASYPGRFSRDSFLQEMMRKAFFYTRMGDAVESLFGEYVERYSERKGLGLKSQQNLEKGRIDFLFSNGIGIDVTNSGTRRGVEMKWRNRRYQESKLVKELWIVVNSDAFSVRDYASMNNASPSNVKIYHMSEVFDLLGKPERDVQLRLEAYALMKFANRKDVFRLLDEAKKKGQNHIIDSDGFMKIAQKKLDYF
jgi:hypothetical protein